MSDPVSLVDPDAPLNLSGLRVHFVGIGGSGMAGLARLAQQAGARCSGSDLRASSRIQQLQAMGIEVTLEQAGPTIPKACDLLVVSAAIKPDHPQRLEADRRGLPTLKYAQMLGRLMLGRTGVAIAGTHGKSTTTAMLSHLLLHAQLDPSFILGAHCQQIGGGCRSGGSPILIAEACEYDRSFHHFHPTHSTILNVEVDHLDLYRNLDEIIEAFAIFAHRLPPEGSLLIQHEMPHRLAITARLGCEIQTIGFAPQADWQVCIEDGLCAIRDPRSQIVARWRNALPGDHMAYNAAVAAVTAHRLGATWQNIADGAQRFQGLDRRMQRLGEHRGATVVDDYGHHPTEIDTTLRALRRHYQPQRLICVFQPHQHSRTRFLMDQFAISFSEADIVIVPDIYFVRDSEDERQAVTANDLVTQLQTRGVTARHEASFDAIVAQLTQTVKPGDLLVTMGAGDVWQIARDFLDA